MNKKTTLSIITLCILIVVIAVLSSVASRNRKNLKSERLVTSTLMTDKTVLQKELANVNSKVTSLKQANEVTSRLLQQSESRLAETEISIRKLTGENNILRTGNKELDAIKKSRAALEDDMNRLKSDYEKLLTESRGIQSALNRLENEKADLQQKLEKTMLHRTDNFLATATRGKKSERLVIKATRTKKVNLGFEVPADLAEDLSFKIQTPAGIIIDSGDKSISWNYAENDGNLTASLSATGEFEASRRVTLNYTPKEKMARGEYRIQVLSNGNAIGSCRLMVR